LFGCDISKSVSKRRLANILKRKFGKSLPRVKIGFKKTAFSRWAGEQCKGAARLRQGIITARS
jgi:hypothetical protein